MKRKKHLVKITAATVICLTVFLAVLFGNAHISAESYSVSLQNLGGPVRIVLRPSREIFWQRKLPLDCKNTRANPGRDFS